MVRLKVQEDNVKLKMNAPDGATFRTNEYTPIMSGSSDYNELDNKPSINGHTLEGDQTSEDLGLFSGDYDDLTNKPDLFSGDYDDLDSKPSINGNTLEGDMSTEELGIHIPEDVSELNNDSGFITSPNVVYCTCATGKGTASKVATIVSGTLTELHTGDQAIVKFTSSNTSASPTLKIGNTDAKAIMRYGTTTPSASADTSWNAGSPILFVYDGTYWVMCGYLNTTYSEISVANIINGTGSTAGLVTGRRAKSAVEAFAPVKDVQVGGTSVVSGGVAEIPKIPELVTDLGEIDPEPYVEDVGLYLDTLTESGFYKFTFGDLTYFVEVQALSVENSDTTLVNQHYWGDEEGPLTEYVHAFALEGDEVVDEWQTNYMTLEQGLSTFSPKSHVHYRTAIGALSVWDYCNGSQITFTTDSPIIFTDTRTPRHAWLIETTVTPSSPNRRFIKLTDLHDASVIYQRSGTYSNGVITWGNWYKFTGEAFTPPTGR